MATRSGLKAVGVEHTRLSGQTAITLNKGGFTPRLVNGRPIKSTNQFYNKRRAALRQALGREGTTARMEHLTMTRTRRINHYLHAASKKVIALLVAEDIGTLVIGKIPLWKQDVELGCVNNQQFVQLRHARFIDMLSYKAKLAGIRVIVQEESYTSKASFLDTDPLPVYDSKREEPPAFSGKRVEAALAVRPVRLPISTVIQPRALERAAVLPTRA
jgi:putative transposase